MEKQKLKTLLHCVLTIGKIPIQKINPIEKTDKERLVYSKKKAEFFKKERCRLNVKMLREKEIHYLLCCKSTVLLEVRLHLQM